MGFLKWILILSNSFAPFTTFLLGNLLKRNLISATFYKHDNHFSSLLTNWYNGEHCVIEEILEQLYGDNASERRVVFSLCKMSCEYWINSNFNERIKFYFYVFFIKHARYCLLISKEREMSTCQKWDQFLITAALRQWSPPDNVFSCVQCLWKTSDPSFLSGRENKSWIITL